MTDCIPVEWKPNLSLPKEEFTDDLYLKSSLILPNLPNFCLARNCTDSFTTLHADICNSGGSIHRRHDRVKNVLAWHL